MSRLWKKGNSQKFIGAILVVAFGVAFYYFLHHMGALQAGVQKLIRIMFPFVIGGVMAYILDPICDRLYGLLLRGLGKTGLQDKKKKGLANGLSIVLTLLLLLGLIVLILALIIPQLAVSITRLVDSLPSYAAEVSRTVLPLVQTLGLEEWFQDLDLVSSIGTWAKDTLLPNANTILTTVTAQVSNVVTVIYNLIIGFIVSFYCLNYRAKFALQGKKVIFAVFPFRWAREIMDRLRFANKAFGGFISGKIVDSLIIGVIAFFGCLILRIPYYPLIAVIVGATNIIPFFGPFIGAVPSILLILMENPLKALYFLIFIILLQQFDGNILSPRILSSSVGVSGFWILFSIMLFGGLFGVVGMIVGTPLFAVIYSIVRDCVNSALRRRHLPSEAWRYDDLDEFERQYAPEPAAESAAEDYIRHQSEPRESSVPKE